MNKTLTKISSILASEIECSLFEEHVVPALEVAQKVLATQHPEPRAEVKPRKVERHSDMSVLVVFCSTREASVFEKEISARAGEGQ